MYALIICVDERLKSGKDKLCVVGRCCFGRAAEAVGAGRVFYLVTSETTVFYCIRSLMIPSKIWLFDISYLRITDNTDRIIFDVGTRTPNKMKLSEIKKLYFCTAHLLNNKKQLSHITLNYSTYRFSLCLVIGNGFSLQA